MISFAEFEIALRGLFRLMRFDAAFAGFFDLSQNGAKRSFRLAIPLLPVYLLLLNLNTPWPEGADVVRIGSAELIGYVLSWVIMPLLLMWCASAFRFGPRVYGAIAVYNWLSVLSTALQVPISVAIYLGLDPDLGDLLGHGAAIFITACEFFVFKRLLDIAFEGALALALTDFLLGWLIVQMLIVPLAVGQF
jgi:hypothetical protein